MVGLILKTRKDEEIEIRPIDADVYEFKIINESGKKLFIDLTKEDLNILSAEITHILNSNRVNK